MNILKTVTVGLLLGTFLITAVSAEVSSSSSYTLKQAAVSSSSSELNFSHYKLANSVGHSVSGSLNPSINNLVSGYVPRVPWIDHDGDGMYSSWEIKNSLNQYLQSDAYSDIDQDGLMAIREFLAGADPNDDDSDGDGVIDGDDFFPLDPAQWQLVLEGVYKGLTLTLK